MNLNEIHRRTEGCSLNEHSSSISVFKKHLFNLLKKNFPFHLMLELFICVFYFTFFATFITFILPYGEQYILVSKKLL